MKKLQQQLISVSKTLATLLEEVEKITAAIAELQPVKKAAPAKKAASAKKVAQAKTAASAKKAEPEVKAVPDKPMTVFETVYEVIRRSRNGATIAKLKEKTSLTSRQISNAVYKLSRKGRIVSKSRGVYTKKK